jgi:hypothetical protein
MICIPPSGGKGVKKRQADYIAPLQPLTLAAFRPWEGSAGAGRVRPAGCKCKGFNINSYLSYPDYQ